MTPAETVECSKYLGVDILTLKATHGKLTATRFDELLRAIQSNQTPNKIRMNLAEGFRSWAMMADHSLVEITITSHLPLLMGTIYQLISSPNDDPPSESTEEYHGRQSVVKLLIESLRIFCLADRTQRIVCLLAIPLYECFIKFIHSHHTPSQDRSQSLGQVQQGLEFLLNDKSYLEKSSSATERCSSLTTLLTILPHSRLVRITNFTGIMSIVLWGGGGRGRVGTSDHIYPHSLKQAIIQAFRTLCRVNEEEEEMVKFLGEMMELIATREYDELLLTFHEVPHFFIQHPEPIIPHVPLLISLLYEQKQTFPSLIPTFLLLLKEIARASPVTVFPHLTEIIAIATAGTGTGTWTSMSAAGGGAIVGHVAGIISQCSSSTIGDLMLEELIKLLSFSSHSTLTVSILLTEILNITRTLSSPEALTPHLPLLASKRHFNELVVTALEDFHAGRPLPPGRLEIRATVTETRRSSERPAVRSVLFWCCC
jgi:hypothetical protein